MSRPPSKQHATPIQHNGVWSAWYWLLRRVGWGLNDGIAETAHESCCTEGYTPWGSREGYTVGG